MIVNLCKYSNYKYVYFCIWWRLKAFLDTKTSSQRFQEFNFKPNLRACLFVFRCDLWVLKLFLELKVLSQRLQGMTTPSRWFASMWFLMSLPWPSFPHTLQISGNWCPLALRFWLFSIIEFTSLSSSSKSTELFPWMANVLYSPRLWLFLLGACLHNGQEIFRLQPSCSL